MGYKALFIVCFTTNSYRFMRYKRLLEVVNRTKMVIVIKTAKF